MLKIVVVGVVFFIFIVGICVAVVVLERRGNREDD